VIALLNERFVPVAIDSHDYRSSRDADGRFFQAVAFEALLNPANPDGGRSYQGHYAIHPGGAMLGAQNRRGAAALLAMLEGALAAYAETDAGSAPPADPERDARYDRTAPRGTLVLNVYARVSADESCQPDRREFARWNEGRAGFDHLWVLPDELDALAPRALTPGATCAVPQSLARRIARFHLVDTVRGEAPKYRADEVRRADLRVTVQRVSSEGEVHLSVTGQVALRAGGDYPRAFSGEVEGELVYDVVARRFLRFDLLASGTTSGTGRWNPGAPAGEFELRVGIEIPPAEWASPIVAPHGARDMRGYLRP
jgi:hypothetical protein